MANNDNNQKVFAHQFSLEERKCLHMTGVLRVNSFDENAVLVKTNAGTMQITGKNLHITALRLEEGHMIVDGEIDSIVYRKSMSRRKVSDLFK